MPARPMSRAPTAPWIPTPISRCSGVSNSGVGARLRPVAGVGLVAQSDTNAYVSTPVNFSLSLGLAVGERVSVEWRHFSNAGTDGPNLGQDTMLLRWRFP